VARPKVPLIDRQVAIATALALIDRDGLEAFSTRRLAAALGVNAPSLYHHFRDKQAILDGVRTLIALESDLAAPVRPGTTWQERIRASAVAYRELLLRHPNVAPLMHPASFDRPLGVTMREDAAAMLLAAGVPADLVHPLLDSTELLAYASALVNPEQRPAADRLVLAPGERAPALRRALGAAPATAQEVFEVQLDVLLTGWTERIRGR
jgi:TetR/AcrR family tetracycline transcriptional repressor